MSSKINVLGIIHGHWKTLEHNGTGKVSFSDVFTFILFPLILAVLTIVFEFKFTNDLTSLLVNFGAIFTALLLSVLVLVYDQSTKLEDNKPESEADISYKTKRTILDQLYYNICYSIIVSVLLVVSCFIESICRGKTSTFTLPLETPASICIDINTYVATPLVTFSTVNLIFTILMIVKRMHALLTSD
ncbi:hypothetical protein [Vibrio sp. Hep-1b-8]|uniref:hypothetical protein n=1 Tax=Vibrio sp. Hep-1b-8 TaxID=2144187 RepID=UPI0011103ACF|nr:hypothetical protein [Vibrio sp. Hep-1b-8]TMX41435.1 hypothetical protein DA100_08015 [Vibrio sp. Hep-1b-8]